MRYLRLYLHFLKFSFSKAMQFRLDFSFRIFMDAIYYVVQFAFFNVIFLHTNLLGGWTIEQLRIFIASYLLVDALHMTIFANNCWWLPIYINRGDLDSYLTKPVSSLFFLSLRDFAANSFVNVILAIGIFIWALTTYSGTFTAAKLFMFIMLILNGCFIYYLIHLLFIIPTFWSGSPRGFSDVFFAVMHTMERPHKIFTGAMRGFVTFILPFAMCASMPAEFLFSPNSWGIVGQILLVTFTLFLIVLFLWSRGLRSYSSASS
jgi:ABC-2 type transport system permease protein